MGDFYELEAIKAQFTRAANDSVKRDEFEAAWENMIKRHSLRDNEWLQFLYDDRKKWVPIYLKESFFAGTFPVRLSEGVTSILWNFEQRYSIERVC